VASARSYAESFDYKNVFKFYNKLIKSGVGQWPKYSGFVARDKFS
jgi:hypothetical protein